MHTLPNNRRVINNPYLQLVDHFVSSGWPVAPDPLNKLVHLSYKGRKSEYPCAAALRGNPTVAQFFTIFPKTIPSEKFSAISEFTVRANFGMILGRFELGLENGNLRFQTAAFLPDETFDAEVMRRIVVQNITVVEIYYSAISDILFLNATPVDAVNLVEAGRKN